MENQIFQDLKGLHLSGMAECWQNLQETRKHQEIVLQDGLAMLIQAEHDQRVDIPADSRPPIPVILGHLC